MRRPLYFFAALLLGAASAASAQSRAIAVARLIPQRNGPPTLGVHVSGVLEDPTWSDSWNNAYVIHIHWLVQLSKVNPLVNSPRPATEWDVYVQRIPSIDVFTYTERTARGETHKSWGTLDSLKAYLTQDVELPKEMALPAGKWTYRVEVQVSATADDPNDTRRPVQSGLGQAIIGFLSGGKSQRDLPIVTRTFTWP